MHGLLLLVNCSMIKYSLFLRLALVILLALQARPVCAAEILVSAAISLREAFVEIGQQFEKKHAGNKVLFNFGASGELAKQVVQGAPVDVCASASFEEMQELKNKALVLGNLVSPIARNKLVVIYPVGSKKVSSLTELGTLKRVTIGNPQTVPAGRYAMQALSKAKVYNQLLDKHALVFAESVRQALNYVEGANVDAGIVYATDVRHSKLVTVSFAIAAQDTEPIIYPIAVIGTSKHIDLGRSFVDFVKSKTAQQILVNNGFLLVSK